MAKITPVDAVWSLFDSILKAPASCELNPSVFKPTLEFSNKLFDEFRELYSVTLQVKPANSIILSGDIANDRYLCGLKHEVTVSYFDYDELGLPQKEKFYELQICKNQLQGNTRAVCREFHQYQSVLESVSKSLDTLTQNLVALDISLLDKQLEQLAIKSLLFGIEWFNDMGESEELTLLYKKQEGTMIELKNEKLLYSISICNAGVIINVNTEKTCIASLDKFKRILQTEDIPFDLDIDIELNLLRMFRDLKYALKRLSKEM